MSTAVIDNVAYICLLVCYIYAKFHVHVYITSLSLMVLFIFVLFFLGKVAAIYQALLPDNMFMEERYYRLSFFNILF